MKAQRIGFVIRLKRDKIGEYKQLHQAVWPNVLEQIKSSNIRNYSIYLYQRVDGEVLLFSRFEYVGTDYEADMKKMADDPETQRWWQFTAPLQERVPEAQAGEWWHELLEVFHTD